MNTFQFLMPTRILFGAHTFDQLGAIASGYGKKCMLVTASNQEAALQDTYDNAKSLLSQAGIQVYHFDEVQPNPSTRMIEKAILTVRQENIDFLIAIGGGSSMDTAKAISLFHECASIDWESAYQKYDNPFRHYDKIAQKKLSLIAVPTTAGTGSEVTQAMIVSEYDKNIKNCIFYQDAFPDAAIIDPCLSKSMPAKLTAMTGFDAFCHAFESYFRKEASEISKFFSISAMQGILHSLPKLMQHPENMVLRETMSKSACYAGISLANAAAHLPHPLSEIIGGIRPDIPHGIALATVYPCFVAYCAKAYREKSAALVQALHPEITGTEEEIASKLPVIVTALLEEIGLRLSLHEFHISPEEKAQMCGHFLLDVLPFADKETRKQVMESAFL